MANPMSDQFIAVTSGDNITYTCTVDSGSTVVWEVERSQIRSSNQFMDFADRGVIIDPPNTQSTMSTITVVPSFRMSNREILVQCLASQGINSIEGETYRVITFGRLIVIIIVAFVASMLSCTHPHGSVILHECG